MANSALLPLPSPFISGPECLSSGFSLQAGNVKGNFRRGSTSTKVQATLASPRPGVRFDPEEERPSFELPETLRPPNLANHRIGEMARISPDSDMPVKQGPHVSKHKLPVLVLMRHGESMWNDLKLFTGDVDIPLTERGVNEAMAGGKAVGDIDFDMIFTSRLMRSKQTALLAMTQNVHHAVPVIVRGGYYGNGKTGDDNRIRLRESAAQALRQAECRMVPVYADPALNERCYGDLQGLNKEAAAREFGTEQVDKWRRSHDTRPPKGESLKDTYERTMSFFSSTIEPRLQEGKHVLVVAHGNVLRCMISHLCGLSEMEMLRLQIVTALPYSFVFNGDSYAQCCVLPPIDPLTNLPKAGLPHGLASVLKRGEIDSLI